MIIVMIIRSWWSSSNYDQIIIIVHWFVTCATCSLGTFQPLSCWLDPTNCINPLAPYHRGRHFHNHHHNHHHRHRHERQSSSLSLSWSSNWSHTIAYLPVLHSMRRNLVKEGDDTVNGRKIFQIIKNSDNLVYQPIVETVIFQVRYMRMILWRFLLCTTEGLVHLNNSAEGGYCHPASTLRPLTILTDSPLLMTTIAKITKVGSSNLKQSL